MRRGTGKHCGTSPGEGGSRALCRNSLAQARTGPPGVVFGVSPQACAHPQLGVHAQGSHQCNKVRVWRACPAFLPPKARPRRTPLRTSGMFYWKQRLLEPDSQPLAEPWDSSLCPPDSHFPQALTSRVGLRDLDVGARPHFGPKGTRGPEGAAVPGSAHVAAPRQALKEAAPHRAGFRGECDAGRHSRESRTRVGDGPDRGSHTGWLNPVYTWAPLLAWPWAAAMPG